MLKPTSTYKMSKPTKTGLALSKFKNKEQRDQWKRAMIDAELCSRIVVKSAPRDRNAPRGNAPSGPAGVTGSHAYTTPNAE
jgi:hypothetical protein